MADDFVGRSKPLPLPVNEKLFGIDGRIGFGVRWVYGSSICEANMAARPLPVNEKSLGIGGRTVGEMGIFFGFFSLLRVGRREGERFP